MILSEMKFIFLLFSFFTVLLSWGKVTPQYEYYLYDSFENADINYNKIDSIDSFPGGKESMMNVFSPCPGSYRVVRYMSHDYGFIHESTDSLNGMIILSVDTNNIIVDGFLVLLHLGEYPFSEFMMRTNKHIKLKSKMDISDLEFFPYSRDKDVFELPFMQRLRYLGFLSSKKQNKKCKSTFDIFKEQGHEYRRYIRHTRRKLYNHP